MTVRFSTTGFTPEQTALAAIILALIAGVLLLARYKMQYVGLASEEQRRQKKVLVGQRADQTPRTLQLNATDHLNAQRDRIHALFQTDPPGDDGQVPVRAALDDVRDELSEVWHGRIESIPRLGLLLIEEAIGLAVLGGLAVLPTAAFARAFNAGGSLTLDHIWQEGVTLSVDVFETGLDIAGLFPYGDILWSLTVAYGILLVDWLYHHPFITASLLTASAIAIIYLDRRVPEGTQGRVVQSPSAAGLSAAGAVVSIWLAGVLPTAAGHLLGIPTVGSILGFLAALAVAAWTTIQTGRRLLGRVLATRRPDHEGVDAPLAAYIVVRRIGAGLAGMVAPLVVVYAVVVLVNGKLTAVAAAFARGSLGVQVLALVVVALTLGTLVVQVRDAWPALGTAVRQLTNRKAVRFALWTRAAPVVVLLFVTFFAIGLGLSLPLAFALGLLAAAGARWGYVLYRRLHRKAVAYEPVDYAAVRVVIQAYTLETADGDPRYYALVNTVPVAAEDPAAATDAVLAVARDLFEDGEPSPMVEREFATDLLEYGIVDIEETRDKVRQSIKTEVFGRLARADHGRLEAEALEAELEGYPEAYWRSQLRKWVERGKLQYRNGYYLRV